MEHCGLHCLKIEHIGVTLGGETLLRDVSLHAHCGELTALIGRNGAGKSTLLKAILGELPHTGKVDFSGHDGAPAAGKTGTAEIGSDKSREISWFVGFRTGVSDEDARLALVMIEIPNEDKYTNLKFDIARAMLEMEAPPDEDTGG